jgi:polygalacturonase
MRNASLSKRAFLGWIGASAGATMLGTATARAGAVSALHGGHWLNARDFGAVGDGTKLDTAAIQAAMDAAAKAGGGTVLLPPGTYLSGTLFLKSGVHLYLEAGAVLLGSKDVADYPENRPAKRSWTDRLVNRSLIAGEKLKNVAIRGHGTIDGQGAAYGVKYLVRPYLIRLVECEDVLVEGVHLQNSAMWLQHYLACERVMIRGVTVFNFATRNNDGVDIDGCRDVCISDCIFRCDDDGITLKSTMERPCENVVVTNCVVSTHCNAIKMGTESHGGFKNITISNCAVYPAQTPGFAHTEPEGQSGIALMSVDGGHIDGITISNISIQGMLCPIFMRLGDRGRIFTEGVPRPKVGTLRNVQISNVVATGAGARGCFLAGIPGHAIENLTLENIQITFKGGGTVEQARQTVPENETGHPQIGMFGAALPAYGFFCRHVDGLVLQNIRLRTQEPDLRPALVCSAVSNLRVTGLDASSCSGAEAMMSLRQVQDALIQGCQPATAVDTFLKLEGDKCGNVTVLGNGLARVRNVATTGPDVAKEALSVLGNRLPEQGSGT